MVPDARDIPHPQEGVEYDNSHPHKVIVRDTRPGQECIYEIPKRVAGAPAGPSLPRKILNYTKAQIKHTGDGRKKASLATIQERYKKCLGCPHDLFEFYEPDKIPASLKKIEGVGKCNSRSCGCYIHGTQTSPNKLLFESEACPKGEW